MDGRLLQYAEQYQVHLLAICWAEVLVEFCENVLVLIESAYDARVAVGWHKGLSKYSIIKNSCKQVLVMVLQTEVERGQSRRRGSDKGQLCCRRRSRNPYKDRECTMLTHYDACDREEATVVTA